MHAEEENPKRNDQQFDAATSTSSPKLDVLRLIIRRGVQELAEHLTFLQDTDLRDLTTETPKIHTSASRGGFPIYPGRGKMLIVCACWYVVIIVTAQHERHAFRLSASNAPIPRT